MRWHWAMLYRNTGSLFCRYASLKSASAGSYSARSKCLTPDSYLTFAAVESSVCAKAGMEAAQRDRRAMPMNVRMLMGTPPDDGQWHAEPCALAGSLYRKAAPAEAPVSWVGQTRPRIPLAYAYAAI